MKQLFLLLTLAFIAGNTNAQQAVPYTETFESFTPFTTPGGGWSGGFQVYSTHGTNSSKGLIKNVNNFTTKDSTTSPKIGVVTATSYLKFDYRFVEVSLYPSTSTLLGPGDMLTVKAAGSDGIYNTMLTIDQNNHTASTAFKTDSVSLSEFAGDSIKVRFVIKRGTTGDYFIDIDNLAVTGGGSIPSGLTEVNANSTFVPYPNPAVNEFSFKLKSNTAAVNVELINMLGQKVYNNSVKANNGTYTVADLNVAPGLYIARVNDNGNVLTHKVYIAK